MDFNAPKVAMVFAAGFGKRMLPITQTTPKALVKVRGKALIDYVLDSLAENGVQKAVVNTHYLAEQIHKHLATRQHPQILISHESPIILETGGGIIKAMPMLGDKPFYVTSTDTILLDIGKPALLRLAESWNAEKMDALLLLVKVDEAVGYYGRGDFELLSDGMLRRDKNAAKHEFVYSGLMIVSPEIFKDRKADPFSYTGDMFLKEKKYNNQDGVMPRLYGIVHDGKWLHVGTPESIKLAEDIINGN